MFAGSQLSIRARKILSTVAGYWWPSKGSAALHCDTIVTGILVGIVAVCCIILMLSNIISMYYVFELNYNEGWNVYNTQRLINGEIIYDDNYWRVNNYPIFSFVVVAGLNFFIHDLLLGGRILSLVSLATVGLLAGVATRRFGGDRIDAVFGGICALGFCYLIAPAWIAVDDPQTFAEAVMLAGFVCYLSNPASRRSLAGAGLLIVLALFTKHNLAAIPLAITLDLAIRSPLRLPFWLATCASVAAGLLGLTQLIAGGAFLEHLLSPRVFIWYNVHYHFMKYVLLFKTPLIIVLLTCFRTFDHDRFVLAAYGVISLTSGSLLSGFDGASYNTLQDSAVFLAIAAGVTLHELRKWVSIGRLSKLASARVAVGLAPALLALPIVTKSAAAFGDVLHTSRLLVAISNAEQSFSEDVTYVSNSRDPVICESLLLCYMSRKPFTLDPFNSRQAILDGRLDQNELIRRVSAKDFSVIQLRTEICDDKAADTCHILHYPRKFNRFTDEFLYAVHYYYRIDRASRLGVFYVPK